MKDKNWEPQASLDQYFPEHKVSTDEIEILRFVSNFLKRKGQVFDRVLDFGAGPVIHRLFSIAPYVKKIYISEYLSESLDEIRKWKNDHKESRNWNFYIKTVLGVEKRRRDKNSIAQRATLLKRKIKRLISGDIFKQRPLGKKITFPLVVSFYCLDAVTSSKKTWAILMKNLSSLVASNGWLIISASRNTSHSFLGNKKMSNVELNEKDLYLRLLELGYKPDTIEISVINAKIWSHVGISSVMVARAQKGQ